MGKWVIAGEPNGAEPKAGTVYEVRHQRKGTFYLLATAVNDEWLTGVIVRGKAKAMLPENVREKGEEITIRDSLSYLVEKMGAA